MQLAAAVSSAVAGLVSGPAQPARLLGVGPAAIYLAPGGLFIHSDGTNTSKSSRRATGTNEKPGGAVVAVLAHDAVRLPCGAVLPTTSAELPLTAIGPDAGAELLIGDGRVSWSGPDEPIAIEIVREWPVSRVGRGRPAAAAVTATRARLQSTVVDFRRWSDGNPPQCAELWDLLGRGPGLTPAGDDMLAGMLLGWLAFGAPGSPLSDAIAALAAVRTTALSAALLAHAGRGECIPEAAEFAAALTGTATVEPALQRLLRVGHTSGAALALGLVLAAEHALAADPDEPQHATTAWFRPVAAGAGRHEDPAGAEAAPGMTWAL